MMAQLRRLIPPLYAAVLLLCLWELSIRLLHIPTYVFPSPSAIWSYANSVDPGQQLRWLTLWQAAVRTFVATGLGFVIAVVVGVLIGTVLAAVDGLRKGVYPLANLLQMVPVIALAPLLNIWFGHGIAGVAASAAIVAIFPMIANTVDGLRSGDPKLHELFQVHGASNWHRWYYLELPSALPNIFTGMKISAGLSVIGAVVGELVSGVINHPPTGALIAQGLRNSNLPLVFGAVLASALIGFAIFAVVAFLESMVLSKWHGLAAATKVEQSRAPLSVPKTLSLGLIPVILCAAAMIVPAPTKDTQRRVASADTAPVTAVRIQLNWFPDPQFGGFYAAQKLGYFEETGVDVRVVPGGPGVATPQMVATGEVDFAIMGGDQILTTRAQGAPVVAVYAAYHEYPRAIMVHESSPYQSLKALWQSDAKVAVEPGLPFVKWMKRTYGGHALQLVPSAGGLAEFQRDRKQAQAVFVISEPVTMAQRNVPVRIFPVAESGYNPYTVVLATNEQFLANHSDVVEKVVHAVRRGWRAYIEDPTPFNQEMVRLNGDMSLEAMNLGAAAAEAYVQPPSPLELGQMTQKRWAQLAHQLRSVGALPNSGLEPSKCFRNVAIGEGKNGGEERD